jgi:ABC-type Zn uptake system ZnuABC Zn-binding protein ZnuA
VSLLKNEKKLLALIFVPMFLTLMLMPQVLAENNKPIIVCTTSAIGSIVEEYLGEDADVVVLVRPSLCPADFDMKPSDIYAVSNAKILFKQNIPGEFWLQGLLDAAGNTDLTQVSIPGAYNTPQGAKKYITWVGGNLSETLAIDLSDKISSMVADVDEVSSWMTSQSEDLQTSSVKVICMKWLKVFVESAGFQVVAVYDPPETLSAGDITDLVNTGQSEGVALIVDNMQVDAEFGGGIAVQVGAEHVVLTNFPGAIPKTENLPKMFRYNAEELYNGLNTWRSTSTLREERDRLSNQVTTYQIVASITIVVAAFEAVLLYTRRKRA